MDLIAQAKAGFARIDADDALKERALVNLQTWLTTPDFAAYRPQIEWLGSTGAWSVLLDSFYQVMPFGTGGRRGSVGVGPNRMNPWTLGASVQGHCEYLRQQFPGVAPLRVVLAFDVRQFEDKRKVYNPALPNPVLRRASRPADRPRFGGPRPRRAGAAAHRPRIPARAKTTQASTSRRGERAPSRRVLAARGTAGTRPRSKPACQPGAGR